ncbi:MAG: hypothetical protein WBN39_03350 [Flavobacteriaceae bacterium]
MKAYKLCCLLWVCLVVISCSKSDGATEDNIITDPGADAAYQLLLDQEGTLIGLTLEANKESMAVITSGNNFETTALPQLDFKDGNEITLYQRTGDCSGTLSNYNYQSDTFAEKTIFSDLGICSLQVNAVAASTASYYVAYALEVSPLLTTYFVRVIARNTEAAPVDIPLLKKPVGLTFANNRLFVLVLDEEVTDENALMVFDAATNGFLIEVNLGYNALGIFKNKAGNLIVAYEELHTLLNSETLTVQYVNYQTGKEPNFAGSSLNNFDDQGKLYYEMPPGTNSIYPLVPAVYDFGQNLTVLYAYENFLTEVQRTVEFKIETTTMVGFDEKNGYLLVGYSKSDGSGKGGLLRIKPIPEPALIDHLTLEGIPYDIHVN